MGYKKLIGKRTTMQTQEEMNVLVPEKLAEIERDYDVTVLWAIESGSRAWGFESPDSDFDVRFVYKHKQDFYLSLNDHRDVIELPIDDTWDVSGYSRQSFTSKIQILLTVSVLLSVSIFPRKRCSTIT